MVRKRFYFSGLVQGVGFRYQAYRIGVSLGLTGTVENLPDGRVRMEVQGEEAVIWDLVSSLHRQRFIQIDGMDTEDLEPAAETGFRIVN